MAYLNISNVSQLIAEVKKTYNENLEKHGIENPVVIVNNSGGKDSGATDLLAMEILEGNYRSVAADTGNEHPWTIEHLNGLHEQRGGNPVEIFKAEYDELLFEEKKKNISKNWIKKQAVRAGAYRGIVMPSLGDPNSKFNDLWRTRILTLGYSGFDTPLDACLSAIKKTGNPFLDMCILHGSFPLGRQRFCTEELKLDVTMKNVYQPLIDEGEYVISWSGVRGDESEKRAKYNRFEQDRRDETQSLYNFLPIHKWSASDVFAIYKHFGVKPNPLYTKGMGRVGCMPCILVAKDELAEISARFPEEIERVYEWERTISLVSRWWHWMIVGHVNRRQFKSNEKVISAFYKNKSNSKVRLASLIENKKDKAHVVSSGVLDNVFFEEVKVSKKFGLNITHNKGYKLDVEAYRGNSMLGPKGGVIGGTVYDAVEWSKTGRGGMVYDLITESLTQEVCSSKYGLCE